MVISPSRLANEAKIVRSRDAQCKSEESPSRFVGIEEVNLRGNV